MRSLLAVITGLLLLCDLSLAQPSPVYPNRSIRVIVPLGPGGVPDVMARAVGEAFGQRNGAAMIVDNRPGANTIIGAQQCATAAPDGYTLCILTAATLSANPSLYKKLPYDAARSFEPVALLAVPDLLLATGPQVPARTLKEFIAYAQTNPGRVNYTSFGAGSDVHVFMEWFKRQTKTDIQHIPFNGIGPMMQSFYGGETQLVYLSAGNTGLSEQAKTGKITALAVNAAARSPLFPDTPTFQEAGLIPPKAKSWFAVMAPAGTPKATLAKLREDIGMIMKSPAMQERLRALGLTWTEMTSEQLTAYMNADRRDWGELVRAGQITLD